MIPTYHKTEIVNGKLYHLTRVEGGPWDIEEDMTEKEWEAYCAVLVDRMKNGTTRGVK